MKKEIHPSKDRGESKLDWLHSRFSFSFADYYNPNRMGFGKLRVLNDDTIAPGKGFGAHSHADMEIITIVTEGQLEHKDSTGVTEVIKQGEVQVMSAGSGITHSEYNHSKKEPVKLFQIWIETKEQGIAPRHDKKSFNPKKNSLTLVVSGTKEKGALYIHQHARISLAEYDAGVSFSYEIEKGKGVFILVIEGSLEVAQETIGARSAIAISETSSIQGKVLEKSRFMMIEVPMA